VRSWGEPNTPWAATAAQTCITQTDTRWALLFNMQADIVPDGDGSRLGAFGAVSGVTMLGFVVGPLLAAVLPEKYSFQVRKGLGHTRPKPWTLTLGKCGKLPVH